MHCHVVLRNTWDFNYSEQGSVVPCSFLFSICSPWLLDIRISTCYWYNVFTIVIHNDGPGKLRQLNFARIVRAYVSKFALTDPREAVQYYYLLR